MIKELIIYFSPTIIILLLFKLSLISFSKVIIIIYNILGVLIGVIVLLYNNIFNYLIFILVRIVSVSPALYILAITSKAISRVV